MSYQSISVISVQSFDEQMSDNQKTIEDFCRSRGYCQPVITVQDIGDGDGTQFMATIIVTVTTDSAVVDGQQSIRITGVGESEVESRDQAMKRFIEEQINKKTEEFAAESYGQTVGRQSPTRRALPDSSSQPIRNEDDIKDDVSLIINSVGHLNELCTKKGYPFPTYDVIGQSGEPHNPTFTFRCSLSIGSRQIVGTGRGCPKTEAKKRSAHSVIRQLIQLEASGPAQTTPSMSGPSDVPKVDIHSYFRQKLKDCRELQEVIENGLNSYQKLKEVADLLDCRLEYLDSGDQVVLRLLTNGLENYPLVTTFGSGHKDSDVNRSIAQKKAILMIKILYTNDDN